MLSRKPKVFVGMSGGVDSSVSAALLKKAGYDVTGVFIKVWSPDWLPCTWREERRDAMRVAAHLDIPFLTFDFTDEYKKEVVDYMLAEYKKGRTPNPDVMCNKEIKFGMFLKKALDMGADYIATGHYAVHVKDKANKDKLLQSKDTNKDQTYFLYTLTQEQLKYVSFPVGNLEKSEVRKLAVQFKLPTAQKKDSQGLCFIGKVEMKEFLSHYIEPKLGRVINEAGKEIGTHDGVVFYTVGERHGFTIYAQTPHNKPYYIISKDIERNTLTVSHKEKNNGNAGTMLTIGDANWIRNQPELDKKYMARYRYKQALLTCSIQGNQITFLKPESDIAIGQSLVVYDGEECLGGGIVEAVS
jgi:tRNA-specific 2-thiouridylase